MKSAIVALCIVACAYASSDSDAQVVANNYEQAPSGDYKFSYETDNGIRGDASGTVKEFGKGEVAIEVVGSNSYIAPDGTVISTNYVADENGFRPEGAHLPTPPEPEAVPEYILRAIQYIKDHPYQEPKA